MDVKSVSSPSQTNAASGTAATAFVAPAPVNVADAKSTVAVVDEFKIQIASDLHLEHMSDDAFMHDLIQPGAPYLALLGDIGVVTSTDGFARYSKFVLHMSEQFKEVFIIAGNHEYYCTGSDTPTVTMQQVDAKIKQLCQTRKNLHYLNRSSYVIDGAVRVVGATLWSHVPRCAATEVSSGIADYKRIYIADEKRPSVTRSITVADTNKRHMADVAFLKTELAVATLAQQQCVVLTHHAPLSQGVSDPAFEPKKGEPKRALNHAFCTALDAFFDHKQAPDYRSLKVWAFGHTHHCVRRMVGESNVVLVANQRGYEPYQLSTGYEQKCVVTISTPQKPLSKSIGLESVLSCVGADAESRLLTREKAWAAREQEWLALEERYKAKEVELTKECESLIDALEKLTAEHARVSIALQRESDLARLRRLRDGGAPPPK